MMVAGLEPLGLKSLLPSSQVEINEFGLGGGERLGGEHGGSKRQVPLVVAVDEVKRVVVER
jgi:hypothetical protein